MKTKLFWIGIACVLLCGCGNKSHYEKGVELFGVDDEAAERHLLMALGTGDHVAEAHYQYALICDKYPEKLGLVAWHLKQYLQLRPDAPEKETVEKWIARAEKRYTIDVNQRLGENVMEETKLRLKILEEQYARQRQLLQELADENMTLRRNLADLQNQK